MCETCVLLLPYDQETSSSISTRDLLIDLKYFLTNQRLFSTAIVEMAIYFAYGAFETYLPLYLTQLKIQASQIGLIFSVQILAIALSKPLFGKIADRVDKRILILSGVIMLGISIGFIGFFQSIMASIILGILFGLSLSFSTVTTSTYIAEVTAPDKLGSSLGALSSIMDIGQTIGPFITGIAITYFSYQIGFLLSLILAVITGLTFYWFNFQKSNLSKI